MLQALVRALPGADITYLADRANPGSPYGGRLGEEIVELTRAGCVRLFDHGSDLVVLACNTAAAVALRLPAADLAAGLSAASPRPPGQHPRPDRADHRSGDRRGLARGAGAARRQDREARHPSASSRPPPPPASRASTRSRSGQAQRRLVRGVFRGLPDAGPRHRCRRGRRGAAADVVEQHVAAVGAPQASAARRIAPSSAAPTTRSSPTCSAPRCPPGTPLIHQPRRHRRRARPLSRPASGVHGW